MSELFVADLVLIHLINNFRLFDSLDRTACMHVEGLQADRRQTVLQQVAASGETTTANLLWKPAAGHRIELC